MNCSFLSFADDFKLAQSTLGKVYQVKMDIYKNNALISCTFKDSNFVYFSTDKGENWNLIYKEKRINYLPSSSSIQQIMFYNENSFILGYDKCNLVITTDKGKNWKEIIPDSTYLDAANYNMFVYNKKLYLFQYKIALESEGNFESWIKKDSPFQLTDSTVYWGLQLTKDGYFKTLLYNAIDSSVSYMSINTKNDEKEFFTLPSYMQAFFFINKDTGWCYHSSKLVLPKEDPSTKAQVIYRTDDGGKNWVKQLDTNLLNARFAGMEFIDEHTGFAYGYWNIIMQTDDGGQNWNLLFPVVSPPLEIGYFYRLRAFDKDNAIFPNGNQLLLLRRNTTGVFEIISDAGEPNSGFVARKGDNIKINISNLKTAPTLITISGKTLSENLKYHQVDENNISLNIPANLSNGLYLILLETLKGKKLFKVLITD
jgi:hypothetical protein